MKEIYVLINSDNDVIDCFNENPSLDDITTSLSECYDIELQVNPFTENEKTIQYEVFSECFVEIVRVEKSNLW